MANFKTQKELLKAIESNLSKLESGEMSLNETEQHLDLVRELYERTIVFRYKALERLATPHSEKEEEPVVTVPQPEPMIVEPEPAPEPEEQPSIDFSLFDEQDEEPESAISFEAPAEEEISAPEPVAPVVETKVETSSFEQAIAPPVKSADFEKRFAEVKNALTGQIGFEKLDTLVGSFGLNERLQYINELFDGSSDSFADAIKQLDNLPDVETAKAKTAQFAATNGWDMESDTVEEFIQKLCRRYV